ncbi:MAG: NAD(P)H-binding protein [Nitrosopumilaceae archaeon]|nr:NAD(P)H-binding protein [Nitrosopumilaceae archaeon]
MKDAPDVSPGAARAAGQDAVEGQGARQLPQHNADSRRAASPTVLVTGATGFIGSRLIPRLVSDGFDVVGMSRRRMDGQGAGPSKGVRYVQADAFDPEGLRRAMRGVDVAYYLIHSMEGGSDTWQKFAEREMLQARNFLEAATRAGVKRIIYLGGLHDAGRNLSPHMRSRKEVGEALASGGIPVTELRASLIIGARGSSYEMLQYLVKRLNVMVCPSWVKSMAQPIAVGDVIEYLARCLTADATAGKVLEIGGPDRVTYEDLMRMYAGRLGRRLFILQIPFLTTRLSSYWVDLVTPVRASLARPLIDSLVHDTVVTDGAMSDIIKIQPKPVRESIDIAIGETRRLAAAGEQQERGAVVAGNGGQGAGRAAVLAMLVLLGAIGTSYYWLDGRADAYHPLWLSGLALWLAAIVAAAAMVAAGTRLGYLIAGVLSAAAVAFWLVDNAHVALGAPIIAALPSEVIVVRNFAGATLAAATMIVSHLMFHGKRHR